MVANNGIDITLILLYLICCSICLLADKLFVDSMCGGIVWRKCKKKDGSIRRWKEYLRGVTFLAKHNI